jgi:hypothetical protein
MRQNLDDIFYSYLQKIYTFTVLLLYFRQEYPKNYDESLMTRYPKLTKIISQVL